MKTMLSSFARSGFIALGLLTGLSAAAFAGPLPGPATGVSDISSPLLVQKVGDRDRNWEGRRHWEGRRNWRNDDRRPRRHYRPRHHRDSGISLGLSWGVPSYRYYEPGYRYVEPSYRYVRPRYVEPRRYNRVRISQSHVNWCYNRYRSYRAYDNTFQPYNGPRQQCYSPYS